MNAHATSCQDFTESQKIVSSFARAFAEAADLDLAVAPMVVAASPGWGASFMLHRLADLYGMKCVEIRLDQIFPDDLRTAPVLRGGEVEMRETRISTIRTALDRGPTIVAVDFGGRHEQTDELLSLVFSHVQEGLGASPAIVVLKCPLEEESFAFSAISKHLGIHHALVPSIRLSAASQPRQILVTGQMSVTGSKRGERYVEIDVSEPYLHQIQALVVARSDQDDDSLNDALDPFWDRDAQVAIRLTLKDGEATFTPDDISLL